MDIPKQTVRAAVIGTGRIGHTYDDEIESRQPRTYYQGENRHAGFYVILPINHAEAYQTTPGFELVAAANRSEAKLHEFGQRRGVQALYTDFRELLRQEQPDVVSVCTQSPEKAEVTIAAAEAGVKAIVVEKAMATSMAEADAMIAACARNGVLLVVNHPYRFSPMVREAKRLVEEGAIGEVTSVTVHAGGGMLHVGTHTLDMMRFWAGDAVDVDTRIPDYVPEQDLAAVGVVHFASGITGFIDHTHRVQQCIEVRGKGGYVTLSGMVGDGWLYRISSDVPAESKRKFPTRLQAEPIGDAPHTMSLTQRMLTELHASLSSGAPFISPAQDGAAALELGLACHASHLAGGPVQIPLADRSLRVVNR
jgi:predicted dehydrogenase